MLAGHKPGINGFIDNLKEAKYASSVKEPLGQTINRNYNLPLECKNEQFQYGKPTDQNQYSAK